MRNVPHSPQHLNTWFMLGGAFGGGLGGPTLLEEVGVLVGVGVRSKGMTYFPSV